MHDPAEPRPTAQIIQFRPRRSARNVMRIAEPPPPSPLVIGKAWYHDEAMTADPDADVQPGD